MSRIIVDHSSWHERLALEKLLDGNFYGWQVWVSRYVFRREIQPLEHKKSKSLHRQYPKDLDMKTSEIIQYHLRVRQEVLDFAPGKKICRVYDKKSFEKDSNSGEP